MQENLQNSFWSMGNGARGSQKSVDKMATGTLRLGCNRFRICHKNFLACLLTKRQYKMSEHFIKSLRDEIGIH